MKSIHIDQNSGNSTAKMEINKAPPETLSEKWNKLPGGVHVAAYSVAAVVGVVMLALSIFCCVSQRRKGRRERKAFETQYNAEVLQMDEYKNNPTKSDLGLGSKGYAQID